MRRAACLLSSTSSSFRFDTRPSKEAAIAAGMIPRPRGDAAPKAAEQDFHSTLPQQRQGHDDENNRGGGDTTNEPESQRSPPNNIAELRRRKARDDVARDNYYAANRPLMNLPWLADSKPNYLHAAERKYGRKESWHAITDDQLRMKLCLLLREYIHESANEARQLFREVTGRHNALVRKGDGYAEVVMGALHGNAEPLRQWNRSAPLNSKGERHSSSESADESSAALKGEDGDDSESHDANASSVEAELAREKQQRDANAYPFLRSRVQSDADAVDPELRAWIGGAFPDDTPDTFKPPAELQKRVQQQERERERHADEGLSVSATPSMRANEVDDIFAVPESRGVTAAAARRQELLDSLGIFDAMKNAGNTTPQQYNRRNTSGFGGEQQGAESSSSSVDELYQYYLQNRGDTHADANAAAAAAAAAAASASALDSRQRREVGKGHSTHGDSHLNQRAKPAISPAKLRRLQLEASRAMPFHRKVKQLQGGRLDNRGVVLRATAAESADDDSGALSYVKVDWNTMRKSHGSAKRDPHVHAAKERVARLKRGEDPMGIPTGRAVDL